MKIAKYVGDLLYDYECVVIPGLGGFITEDKPVSINEITHNFSPPFRHVHFNTHLRANDGLLINYVAQHEQVSYNDSKQRVDKFALQCHNALKAGKRINFQNIGHLFYDQENNIAFTQDKTSNYDPNSFGLNSLISPIIRRTSDEEKIKKVVKTVVNKKNSKKKPADRKNTPASATPAKNKMQANHRKSTFTNQLTFLLVVVLIMGVGYIYMRRDAMNYYLNKYSAHIPFFYSSVNDYMSANINSTHVAQLSRSTASFFPITSDAEVTTKTNEQPNLEVVIDNVSENEIDNSVDLINQHNATDKLDVIDSEIIIPVEVIKNEEVISNNSEEIYNSKKFNNSSPAIINNNFLLIAGSFSKETNAKLLVDKLKTQGFNNAFIADTNKYGMFRVAFMALNNRPLAERELLAIRKNTNPKVWLLVK